nr:MAG TPA: protein of unknown function (DUF5361) [Caudoviricetes sp.]
MEASFQSEYGLALGDIFCGGLSLRRAAVLARNLSPGCALYREMGGAVSVSDETQAVFALTNRVTDLLWSAFGGKRQGRPEPLRAPEFGWRDAEEARREAAEAKATRWMSRQ